MTNIPFESAFERSKFTTVKFVQSELSDYSLVIPIKSAGSFDFRVKYGTKITETSSIIVDPLLLFENSRILPLDGICALTIIPKWMPDITQWPEFFSSFSKTGYNMVHFAPINKRGLSNSPYSINNQLEISNELFPTIISEKEKHLKMKETIEKIKKDSAIFCVTDVVWNQYLLLI
jgi:glycogen debranching enzyme